MKAKSVIELNSYDDRNYLIEVELEHKNPYVEKLSDKYLLKILNSMDSKKNHIQGEHAMQKHINSKLPIKCPQPVLNVEGKDLSYEQLDPNKNNVVNVVRLFTYVPGIIFHKGPYSSLLFYKFGKILAKMEVALSDFRHASFENHKTIWNLKFIPDLRKFLSAVKDEENLKLVTEVIENFQNDVLPNIEKFREGIIHGDTNEQNILISENSEEADIVGIIDFGDSCFSYVVFDLAITVMYFMIETNGVPVLDVGGHILAGYLEENRKTNNRLNEVEWNALKTLICGRFCQSLVMGAYTFELTNNAYVQVLIF